MDRVVQALHDPFVEWTISTCIISTGLIINLAGLVINIFLLNRRRTKKENYKVRNSFYSQAENPPWRRHKEHREHEAFPLVRFLLLCTIIAGCILLLYRQFIPQPSTTFNTTTAKVIATETAQAITANPYPPYLHGKGALILYDPLDQAQHGQANNDWGNYSDTASGASCQFTNGAYLATQSKSPGIAFCFYTQSDNFQNIAFEVQMSILKGDCGGMVFRGNLSTNRSYLFEVCSNGTCSLAFYTAHSQPTTLMNDTTSAINEKLAPPNIIAIVANRNTISLYVNKLQIAIISNNIIPDGGFIGFTAINRGTQTEVAYTSAKVWEV